MVEVDELFDAFGIEKPEKHVPSRFDPTKHNPLWGEELHYPEDFTSLMKMNPCPIPVNGKLATTVRLSVESDGEAEWLEAKAGREDCFQKDLAQRITFHDSPSDIARKRAELRETFRETYRPALRSKTKWIELYEGLEKGVNLSCPVLQQFIDEGGYIGRSHTKIPRIHLSSSHYPRSSLCGANDPSLAKSIEAAFSGQPEEVGTYQVCSVCRRIAEARFKRKVTKRKPKPRGPKPPTPEEIARKERLKIEDERRQEEYRKVNEIENRKLANKHLDIIEKHYPKVDEATREAAIADLMKLWNTGIIGGE